MKTKLRALLSVKVILALLMAAVVLVSALTYYYFTVKTPITVTEPAIKFLDGGDTIDITQTINSGTNSSWAQMEITITPNATTFYQSALKFYVTRTLGDIYLQIADVVNTDSALWGIRYYIYANGSSTDVLQLVDGIGGGNGGHVNVTSVAGDPVSEIGWRVSGAPSEYGATTEPVWGSQKIDYDDGDIDESKVWIIALEAYGNDAAETSHTATVHFRVIWESDA